MYIDSDGTKYYLSETVKLVRRNLEEAKEYVKDYILEVDENITQLNILIDKQANNTIVSETHSSQAKGDNVFEALEAKLALTEMLFKFKLETIAKERIIENITQKDWFYNAFKNAGYWDKRCIFSSLKYIHHPNDLKQGLAICLEEIERQIRKVEYETQKANDRGAERESALGIANAIRLWQEENIDEVRIEAESKRKYLEEIKRKQQIWVVQKMKEIDERLEQKRILMEEKRKNLEEKRKRIDARKAIMEEKKN